MLIRCLIALTILCSTLMAQGSRWTPEQARAWYDRQPWLVGANFLPSTAGNQLEMFQAATWDPKTIDRELGWAASLGMNTMRVYLHDLLWQQDAIGFVKRLREFLGICQKHGIRPALVFFDSCWDPNPKPGPQRAPTPGVHNSVWVQSPGAAALASEASAGQLQEYVMGVVGQFRSDQRILAWDMWNEPDNGNDSSYGKVEFKNKRERVARLLPQAFAWARAAKPSQPLTSGLWDGGPWSDGSKLTAIQKTQLNESDVISFHNYENAASFERRLAELKQYGRPLLCTEYMARGNGSTFEAILPVAKREKVAVINWGLVRGKSQTHLPWDSWEKPYVGREPNPWHHDIFQPDGKAYRQTEVDFIRRMTGKGK
jgi:hypothetical protein